MIGMPEKDGRPVGDHVCRIEWLTRIRIVDREVTLNAHKPRQNDSKQARLRQQQLNRPSRATTGTSKNGQQCDVPGSAVPQVESANGSQRKQSLHPVGIKPVEGVILELRLRWFVWSALLQIVTRFILFTYANFRYVLHIPT